MHQRILVREDNGDNQRVGVRMLERLGYGAEVVTNSADAAEVVGRRPDAVILAGCHLPEMGGYEARSMIRAREKLVTIRGGWCLPSGALPRMAGVSMRDRAVTAA